MTESILPASLDYTDKDFDSLRLRLQSLVRSVFPKWTDYNVATFANILLEMYAFVGDVLCFYQDNQAAESRIVTSSQRKNLLALVKLLNYQPSSAVAATADVTFSIPVVAANDVLIVQGSKCWTADVVSALRFQTLADLTIPAGSLSVTGTVEHSASFYSTYPSTLRPNQEIILVQKPYLDGSLSIVAGDGAYTEVSSFLDSTAADKHFTVSVDQASQATVRFGNGVNGKIPTGIINVWYKTGGGSAGNVQADTIIRVEGSFTDVLGNPVSLSCTNAAAASGGRNRQTMAQIKLLAPESIRASDRTVAREDYEINAKRVAGVSRALMLASDDAPMEENTGKLWVIPAGGGTPSSALKEQVLDMVTMAPLDYRTKWGVAGGMPKTITFHVEVLDAAYLSVSVQATIYRRSGFSVATTKANVLAALQLFFAIELSDGTPNPEIDFGYNLKDKDGEPAPKVVWSDVFNAIRDASGVREVDEGATGVLLNGERADVVLELWEFPRLGAVVLYDGDTGSVM